MIKRAACLLLVAVLVSPIASTIAEAEVRLSVEVKVLESAGSSEAVRGISEGKSTLVYGKDVARADRPDGSYLLFDFKKKRFYEVYSVRKTYVEHPFQMSLALPKSPMRGPKLSLVADLSFPLSSNETLDIAGLTAHRYGLTTQIEIGMPDGGGPPGGGPPGGGPQGGGPPGGGAPPKGGPPPMDDAISIPLIDAEVWGIEAKRAGLPEKQAAFPLLALLTNGPFLKPLADELSRVGVVPLSIVRSERSGKRGESRPSARLDVVKVENIDVPVGFFVLPSGFMAAEKPEK